MNTDIKTISFSKLLFLNLIRQYIRVSASTEDHTAFYIRNVGADQSIGQSKLIDNQISIQDRGFTYTNHDQAIDLVNHLIENQESIPIIYLSSQYDHRILKLALDRNPYGYLTKPIRKETLWTSIEAAYQLFQSKNIQNFNIELFDGKNYHNIKMNDILYAEADHVYLNINMVNGQLINIRKTLKQLMEDLDGNMMIQCHRSYLVNRNHIKSWNSDSLKLINDRVIPISRGKRNVLDQTKWTKIMTLTLTLTTHYYSNRKNFKPLRY